MKQFSQSKRSEELPLLLNDHTSSADRNTEDKTNHKDSDASNLGGAHGAVEDLTRIIEEATEAVGPTGTDKGASENDVIRDDEREEAFRQIVENARVDVVPPATGNVAHPRAFADFFHAKRNKTKIM